MLAEYRITLTSGNINYEFEFINFSNEVATAGGSVFFGWLEVLVQ